MSLILSFDRIILASPGKPERYPSTKSMSPSLVFVWFCFAWFCFAWLVFWFWFFFPVLDKFKTISRYIVEYILEGTLQNKDMANTKQRFRISFESHGNEKYL